jgi:hypothetical protein
MINETWNDASFQRLLFGNFWKFLWAYGGETVCICIVSLETVYLGGLARVTDVQCEPPQIVRGTSFVRRDKCRGPSTSTWQNEGSIGSGEASRFSYVRRLFKRTL